MQVVNIRIPERKYWNTVIRVSGWRQGDLIKAIRLASRFNSNAPVFFVVRSSTPVDKVFAQGMLDLSLEMDIPIIIPPYDLEPLFDDDKVYIFPQGRLNSENKIVRFE